MSVRIAITGAGGFIGQNLRVRLGDLGYRDIVALPHDASADTLQEMLTGVAFVFHLAGVNRAEAPEAFTDGNEGYTQTLCDAMCALPQPPRVAFSSSTQAALDNVYGRSKRAAEDTLLAYAHTTGCAVYLYRLTNVFGKWARPNYNSAVATFCHNIARDLPIVVNDPSAPLRLIHIDDVLVHFISVLQDLDAPSGFVEAGPDHRTTVGEVAEALQGFKASRKTLVTDRVGQGLTRALYSTYVSYLPEERFTYDLRRHEDPRGVFVEMLKTPDCGQFSYFTAPPGVTRGEHYHHTKTEKFLVIKGKALFGFRHIVTGQLYEITVDGGDARIVETVPGWTHNITNIGDEEMIVMLWANEIFDTQHPDTIAMKVAP